MAKFELEKLPYDYNALEPHISEETLKVHHDKHHQTYCDKFNAAVESAGIDSDDVLEIIRNHSSNMAIRNHGGGFWNHQFYWESLASETGEISEELRDAINSSFGSFEEFKNQFSAAAAAVFGSGWTWLGKKEDGSLIIHNTANQDNTFMNEVSEKYTPLLVIDVWEHAYYIDYQNKRPEYIEKFFNVVNWNKVSERFANN
jgi:Fe-Mn family superoxide dismutase